MHSMAKEVFPMVYIGLMLAVELDFNLATSKIKGISISIQL